MTKTEKILVNNLKRLVKAAGMSPLELSKATGISRSGLYNILRADRTPRMENLEALSEVFGVRVWSLFKPPSESVPPDEPVTANPPVSRAVLIDCMRMLLELEDNPEATDQVYSLLISLSKK